LRIKLTVPDLTLPPDVTVAARVTLSVEAEVMFTFVAAELSTSEDPGAM
jgi:hypothetical protein